VPRAVVRGVQVGTGLGLARQGFVMLALSPAGEWHPVVGVGVDSLAVAAAAAALLLLSLRNSMVRVCERGTPQSKA
jgi:hypothetical protein